MGVRVEAVEWELVYPVHVEPVGRIRRRRDGFHAKCGDELLGVYPSGDAAAMAVWGRFVERAHADHDAVSRVHGSHERG